MVIDWAITRERPSLHSYNMKKNIVIPLIKGNAKPPDLIGVCIIPVTMDTMSRKILLQISQESSDIYLAKLTKAYLKLIHAFVAWNRVLTRDGGMKVQYPDVVSNWNLGYYFTHCHREAFTIIAAE